MVLYEDMDSMMDGEQDPDIYYFFIKETINNLDNEISLSITKEKEFKLNQIRNLEVFKSVMQYIEEFGLYFLAYADKNTDLSDFIIHTNPKVILTAFQKFCDDEHDDFAKDLGYKDYKKFLMDVFSIRSQSINVNRKELYDNLKKGIDKIAWFFIYYIELYNAIKHGYRVFPLQISRVDISDPNNGICSIEIDEPYFEAICKNSTTGDKYSIHYPGNLLINNAIRVLEDVHELFNFLRKKNDYKKSTPFKYKFTNNILKYNKAYNDEYSFFLKSSIELDKINVDFRICYAKLSVLDRSANKEIQFSLKDNKSLEYPFTIELGPDYGHSPRPGIKSDLKVNAEAFMDIEQLQNLIKLKNISQNSIQEIKVIFVDDNTGNELAKGKYGDIVSPTLPIKYTEDIINFLVQMKRITQQIIPTPEFMSKSQRDLIYSNINKRSWRRAEAERLITDLKAKKMEVASFIIKKIYPDDEDDKEIFLGTTKKLSEDFLIGYDKDLNSEKFGIKDLAGKTCIGKAPLDPNEFINALKSSLNNMDNITSSIDENYNKNEFGMEINVNLNEEYWYNEYIVIFTIKFREK